WLSASAWASRWCAHGDRTRHRCGRAGGAASPVGVAAGSNADLPPARDHVGPRPGIAGIGQLLVRHHRGAGLIEPEARPVELVRDGVAVEHDLGAVGGPRGGELGPAGGQRLLDFGGDVYDTDVEGVGPSLARVRDVRTVRGPGRPPLLDVRVEVV